MIRLSAHVRKQIGKRGISEDDLWAAVASGDVVIEESDSRFGTKKYSKLKGLEGDLIVIWFFNKSGDQQVVTAYWRRPRL